MINKHLLALLFISTSLIGCNSGGSSEDTEPLPVDEEVTPITDGSWYKPSVSTTWQWQLKDTVNTNYDVELYDIDLFDSSTALIAQIQSNNQKVICYFSAGSYEEWREDKDQFNANDLGSTLDGWEDERWLDIRNDNVRSIMTNRLDLAKQKGCDGVEPDNVDGYVNNSGFNLTSADQLDFNRFIANEAHKRSLSIGLKNDLDQVLELVDYYDFSVNEQCFEYSECETLTPFINQNKPVFNAEYLQSYVNDDEAKIALCTESINLQFSTLILPLDLDDTFRLSCL